MKVFFFFLKNNYNKLLTRNSNHFPPKPLQAFCTWGVANSVTRLNVSSMYQDLQTYLTLTADLAVEVLGYIKEDDIVKIGKPCLFFFFSFLRSKLCLVDVVGVLNFSQLFLLYSNPSSNGLTYVFFFNYYRFLTYSIVP